MKYRYRLVPLEEHDMDNVVVQKLSINNKKTKGVSKQKAQPKNQNPKSFPIETQTSAESGVGAPISTPSGSQGLFSDYSSY